MSSCADKKSEVPRDESFLGRWSRRKRAEPERRELEDAKVVTDMARQRAADDPSNQPAELGLNGAAAGPADLPRIEDLTPASDYRRFMQPDVPRASRNAAMKKLFTDPHFNLMDGLDTYIDDYTKEDPIPLEMLKDLAQSRMLKLFEVEEDKEQEKEKSTSDAPQAVVAQGPQAELPQEAHQQPVFGALPVQKPASAIRVPAIAPVPEHQAGNLVAAAPGTTGVTPSA